MIEELTCTCILDNGKYIKGREYQVDVYPLFKCVYVNGGWKDYRFFSNEEFEKYFELI